MFVMELPRFGRDTTLSFGGIDQFATTSSDNMVVCDGNCQTLIISRIN